MEMSKGSATALAVRKRKLHQGLPEPDALLPPPPSQKFRKTSDSDRTPSFPVANDDRRPWTERFAPNDLTELAVHKRKVADVRTWLETTFGGRRRKVLVLKGAAGTGKTTTLRLLAKEMRFALAEWRNPGVNDPTPEAALSASGQFEEFIRRVGGSGGLDMVRDTSVPIGVDPHPSAQSQPSPDFKHVLLIEEFPSTYSRTSNTLQSFRSAVSQYLASPLLSGGTVTPMVMIISETLLSTNTAAADSFTAHRLLGPELATHPFINIIEFNPIATTFMTKALETVVIKEARKSGRRKTPGPSVLKHLAEIGDIRSAISSLEFMCLRGDEGDTWSSKVAFTKAKKSKSSPSMTKAEEELLGLISNRESSLGIFHAVGKVVYNNRVDPPDDLILAHPPAWLPQHRRPKVPESEVNTLIDCLGTDVSTFTAALHENYALSCASANTETMLSSLSSCIDGISDADLLSVDRFSVGTRTFTGSAQDSVRQDDMSFHAAVRSLLFDLPHPVHRSTPADGRKADAHRMFYPKSLKIWRAIEEVEGALGVLAARVQDGDTQSASTRHDTASFPNEGVEGWKRRDVFDGQHELVPNEKGDGHVAPSLMIRTSKSEMLMDRVPYMLHILSKSHEGPTWRLEQIRAVSSMNGRTAPSTDDDNEDLAESNEAKFDEQWSTDRPDGESQSAGRTKTSRSRKSKGATEGGGLPIPVETRIASFILEDDDIVDD